MFRIGSFVIDKPTILAPMAGVTDLPFRRLCRSLGAGLTVSEMVTANTSLWRSRKSRQRLPHADEPSPRVVQIAGAEPEQLAAAAAANVDLGAEIIDINMGCPAKKVCRKAAGSALLRDEKLVERILSAVVAAVSVPVTLKIRTGWDPAHRNGVRIARLAEDSGVQALAVHGRTRACRFQGAAEYDTIAEIVEQVSIPVFANGDILSPVSASRVLSYTGAAAVMVGRGAQGNPWLFREINHYLSTGATLPPPGADEIEETLQRHLADLTAFYGAATGYRIARKHVGWYLAAHTTALPRSAEFRQIFNRLESCAAQSQALRCFFQEPYPSQKDQAA